jgi:hypothetical protein
MGLHGVGLLDEHDSNRWCVEECRGPGMELTLMMIPGRDLPVKEAVSAVRPAMQEALDNIHHDEKDLSDVETFLHMFNQRRMVGAPFLTRDKDDRLLLKKVLPPPAYTHAHIRTRKESKAPKYWHEHIDTQTQTHARTTRVKHTNTIINTQIQTHTHTHTHKE